MRLIKDGKRYDTEQSQIVKEGIDSRFSPVECGVKLYKTASGNVFMTIQSKGDVEKFLTNREDEIRDFLDLVDATEDDYAEAGISVVDA